jgi:ribosomal protein S18 acetylase RimI-like enzyme
VESCRPAGPGDLARIVELATLMHAELTPLRGGELWADRDSWPTPLETAYAALLERADALVVVGALDDAVLGFGVAVVERLRSGRILGRITDLYAEPEARDVSLGDTMCGALVAWCQDHGCSGVDVGVLPGHRAAKSFFETQGFAARSITMHRPIG